MILTKISTLILIKTSILLLQVQARCLSFSQRGNEEYCEITKSLRKAENHSLNVHGSDTKTTTVSKISPKNVTTNNTNYTVSCVSSNNLQDQLTNIMIESFLDLNQPQNKIILRQNEKQDPNSTFAQGNMKELVNGIKKRSTFELKGYVRKKSKKQNNSKNNPKAMYKFFKF